MGLYEDSGTESFKVIASKEREMEFRNRFYNTRRVVL